MMETHHKIYQMDCLQWIKRYVSDESVDLIITSPPYNIRLKSRNTYTEDYFDNLPEPEYRKRIGLIILELIRVLKKSGSCWINMKSRYLNEDGRTVSATQGSLEPPTWLLEYTRKKFFLKNLIVWNYDINSDTQNNKFHPRYEFWFWFVKDPKNYEFYLDRIRVPPKTQDKRNNPIGANPTNVWYYPIVKGNSRERNFHPAQYPEKMIERIIKACSNEGDLVLDPFLGSGTTSVAAKKLNRNSIGFEINPTYIDNVRRRLSRSQKKLEQFFKQESRDHGKDFIIIT